MVRSTSSPTIAGMPLEDTLRKTLAAATKPPGGRSLREIAAAAEVAPMTLSDFQHGKGSMRLDQAERLAKVLGLRIQVRRDG